VGQNAKIKGIRIIDWALTGLGGRLAARAKWGKVAVITPYC